MDPNRRTLLGALAGLGASLLAGCTDDGSGDDTGDSTTQATDDGATATATDDGTATTTADGGNGGGAPYGGFLDGVTNFDGVVDMTGNDAVTVEVGVEQSNGPFGFGPAAVKVSTGTTVTWEWVDGENSHNVKATGGGYNFESEYASDVGYTFEHTFETAGVAKYVCVPHETLGMKGVVEVVE